MDNTLKQLTYINNKLINPFPHEDVQKLQEDLRSEFLKLSDEEDCFSGDFNTFCMNIAGSLSYVLGGKRIPQNQVQFLSSSFFDSYNHYRFLEDRISNYKDIYEEYTNFEEARKLLLEFLSKKLIPLTRNDC